MEPYPGQKPGSTVYHYDGYDYCQDNKNLLTKVNYKCSKTSCRGRARHPLNEPNAIDVTLHNHARDSTKFRTHGMRAVLRTRALEQLNKEVAEIFREVSAEFPDVAEYVNPVKERRTMRKIRSSALPKIPNTFAELADKLKNDNGVSSMFGKLAALPDHLEKEDFFMHKLEGPGGTSLVFASPSHVEKCLKTSSKVKMDGTFKVMPVKPKGRQLISLHAVHGNNTFPVVFCLMESKKKVAYDQFLDYVTTDLVPGWEPEEITTDFEKAMRMSLRRKFPHAKLIGCYFHFTQAIQKNWSQHGLLKVPGRLKSEAKDLKDSLMSLPFAKSADIPGLYEQIEDNVTLALRVRAGSFLEYFKKTWLCENNTYFKPEDWSIYGHADRTTNHVESFHSRLHLQKPNIWKFLKLLVDIAIESRQNFGRFMNGIPFARPVPQKSLWTEQRVVNARDLFEAGRISPMQFIRWCRQVTRDTQAVVRQGRCLRRYLRAEFAGLQFDDIATSSDDESLNSSFDWEYNPNPHQQEIMEAEDELDDAQGDQNLEDGEEGDLVSHGDESIPSDTNSVWQIEEDEAIMELSQQIDANIINSLPVEAPPEGEVDARPPNACVMCITDLAVWIAMPCRHALLCEDCKPAFMENQCSKCEREIDDFLHFITS